jgi:hypothetical protein
MSRTELLGRILTLSILAGAGAPRAGQPELKTVATFGQGAVELKHGGTPIKWKLRDGTMQSMSLDAGGKPLEVVTYELSYYEDAGPRSTNQNRVQINLSNVPGPGKYPKSSVFVFAVFSKAGTSIHRSSQGTDCTFQLTKADAKGIEGTATCKGKFVNMEGKEGPRVEDVKFSAAP